MMPHGFVTLTFCLIPKVFTGWVRQAAFALGVLGWLTGGAQASAKASPIASGMIDKIPGASAPYTKRDQEVGDTFIKGLFCICVLFGVNAGLKRL